MTSSPEAVLDRKVRRARIALFIERGWLALWPSAMIAGLVLLLVVSGVAGWLAMPLRIAVAAVAMLAFLWCLRPLLALRWPSRQEGLRRIEDRSGLKHRPATAFEDRLAGEAPDADTQAVWQAHRRRLRQQLRGLKAGWPHSKVPARDPYALRNALAIALIAALFLSAGDWRARVAEAVSDSDTAANRPVTLDAWITPPAYTGKAPLLLTSEAALKQAKTGQAFQAPQGSELVIRLNGAEKPALKIVPETGKAEGDGAPPALAIAAASEDNVHEHRTRLQTPAQLILSDGGRELARWKVAILADAPPQVKISGEIEPSATAAFAVPWQATDDYGVAGISARFKLTGQDKGTGQHGRRRLVYDPPKAPVALRKLNPKSASGRAFQDLTAHPWAGLEVELTLEAKDQAGQTGVSAPLVFKLPQRQFRKLLARALIEQRRNIVDDPDNHKQVTKALAALLVWPDKLVDSSGAFLGIRYAASQLYSASTDDDLKATVDLLWKIAVSIEDGDLSDAFKELEALRRQLQKALAENAPPQRIAELMAKLREAMDRYLEAMMRQMQKALKNGDLMQQNRQGRPGQTVRRQDLNKMLDQIENLARSGARDAAQELLSELENMMRNLRAGVPRPNGNQRNSPMGRMLDKLSEMMRRQRDLMDQTQRLPQGRPGENYLRRNRNNGQDGQRQRGEGTRPGQQQSGRQLSQDQSALGKMLEDLLKQLDRQGLNAPKGLTRSRRAMQGAAEALQDKQKGRALGRQGEALHGLQQGANQIARSMRQQGTGNEGNPGRHGEARGDQRDPLGRPMPRTGEDRGPERNMLPSDRAIQRAREILDLLRNRSNTPDRPRLELDYYERLLRGLY